MKRRIRRYLSESFVELLSEGRLEWLMKTFVDNKEAKVKLTRDQLFEIIRHDPTTNPPHPESLKDVRQVGQYVQWIITQWKKLYPKKNAEGKIELTQDQIGEIHLFFEDLHQVEEYLRVYDKVKNRRSFPQDKKDIMKDIGSIPELAEVVYPYMQNWQEDESEVEPPKEIDPELKVQYIDNDYLVVTPMSVECSVKYFHNPVSTWCTAQSSASSYYSSYMRTSPLYIVIDRHGKPQINALKNLGRVLVQIHHGGEGGSYQFNRASPTDQQRIQDIPAWFADKPGLKAWYKPVIKKALEGRSFDLNSNLWQTYIGLYGSTPEIKEIVTTSFRNLVQKEEKLSLTDTGDIGTKIQSYISILGGHDAVLDLIFKFAQPNSTKFEVRFVNYTGDGYHIPDEVGKFTNVKNMVLVGFVRSFSPAIGKLKSLSLLMVSNCPMFEGLPEEVCELSLDLFNCKGTPLRGIPPCFQHKMDNEEESAMCTIR